LLKLLPYLFHRLPLHQLDQLNQHREMELVEREVEQPLLVESFRLVPR
jgi:hypothetical protein